MEKPKYPNYRVCYERGIPVEGKEIYELHKNCRCPDCRNRTALKREPVNSITATTKDISKVDEVAEFLKNWTCEDGTMLLKTVYLHF